ncbi:hypothetical protein FOA52_001006 [Chlamydomonas sp. UWO 241]|nr:hypothetical protein FOA52_001006 [Chlamydomonas sp. UWO 241]
MPPQTGRKRGADEMEDASGSGSDSALSASFTWRIRNFSKLTAASVYSASFEAGIIGPWHPPVRLCGAAGCHGMGARRSDFTEYTLTLVNQADASKSHSWGPYIEKFNADLAAWGSSEFFKLSALNDAADWLVNNALVLTADFTVENEDRFQLDTGVVPCDVALKLPCGAEVQAVINLLQMASPFFGDALEDVNGSAPIPVDGSPGT